jgi:hypothetical protein
MKYWNVDLFEIKTHFHMPLELIADVTRVMELLQMAGISA